jgi:hypothetical protein
MNVKLSEMPDGTIVEVYGERFERQGLTWNSLANNGSFYTLRSMDMRQDIGDVSLIAVSYGVAYQLATWLDNVYTKQGVPESLIVEAGEEAKKTKDDPHIGAAPKLRK